MVKQAQDRLPPYVAYTTWQRLIRDLGQNVPARFDSSYFESLKVSGTNRSMLKGALIYLGLCSADSVPTERLQQLAKAEGEIRKSILRSIVKQGYGDLFNTLNIEHATPAQLRSYFQNKGTAKDISRKCVSFFLNIADDAGIPIPSLLRKSIPAARKIMKKQSAKARTDIPMLPMETANPLHHLLISKFPDFDVAWPTDTKNMWFEDFKYLVDKFCGPNQI